MAVLRLHNILLVTPEPIAYNSDDFRWKWFKGCLGELDGSYIDVTVPLHDQPCYRNRKGYVTINLLVSCDKFMWFTFVLSGWEGSAADSRVLRDAISRPTGLHVPIGNYYLANNGYINGPGFLTPYRGVRYHLGEWGSGDMVLRYHREIYNMRHARARNVIECSFGLLKGRWEILRSRSFYLIKKQSRIITACYLIHNLIRIMMTVDPSEESDTSQYNQEHDVVGDEGDFVDQVTPMQELTNYRDTLALSIFNEHRG